MRIDFDRSAFPQPRSGDPYGLHPWNLINIPYQHRSLLKHVRDLAGTLEEIDLLTAYSLIILVKGISMPWLYFGMMFSTFCWHVEDNYLYSINYMHEGKPKIWYGVPSSDANKFDEACKRLVPNYLSENPNLLHDIVTMVSCYYPEHHPLTIVQFPPSQLVAEGVRVTRAEQEAGTFIVTFPRVCGSGPDAYIIAHYTYQSYHAGFSVGNNIGEAVNFAPPDWVPFGMLAASIYREQRRPANVDVEEIIFQCVAKETDPVMYAGVLPSLRSIRSREILLRTIMRRKQGLTLGVAPISEAGSDNTCHDCLQYYYVSAVCLDVVRTADASITAAHASPLNSRPRTERSTVGLSVLSVPWRMGTPSYHHGRYLNDFRSNTSTTPF